MVGDYNRINFQNDGPPPINADNLNKIDAKIEELDLALQEVRNASIADGGALAAIMEHASNTDNPHNLTLQSLGVDVYVGDSMEALQQWVVEYIATGGGTIRLMTDVVIDDDEEIASAGSVVQRGSDNTAQIHTNTSDPLSIANVEYVTSAVSNMAADIIAMGGGGGSSSGSGVAGITLYESLGEHLTLPDVLRIPLEWEDEPTETSRKEITVEVKEQPQLWYLPDSDTTLVPKIITLPMYTSGRSGHSVLLPPWTEGTFTRMSADDVGIGPVLERARYRGHQESSDHYSGTPEQGSGDTVMTIADIAAHPNGDRVVIIRNRSFDNTFVSIDRITIHERDITDIDYIIGDPIGTSTNPSVYVDEYEDHGSFQYEKALWSPDGQYLAVLGSYVSGAGAGPNTVQIFRYDESGEYILTRCSIPALASFHSANEYGAYWGTDVDGETTGFYVTFDSSDYYRLSMIDSETFSFAGLDFGPTPDSTSIADGTLSVTVDGTEYTIDGVENGQTFWFGESLIVTNQDNRFGFDTFRVIGDRLRRTTETHPLNIQGSSQHIRSAFSNLTFCSIDPVRNEVFAVDRLDQESVIIGFMERVERFEDPFLEDSEQKQVWQLTAKTPESSDIYFINEIIDTRVATHDLASKTYVDTGVTQAQEYADTIIEPLASKQYVDDGIADAKQYTDAEVASARDYTDNAITGLASQTYVDSAVDSKADVSYVDAEILGAKDYTDTAVTGLATEEYVNVEKADVVHTHNISDVTGLQDALDSIEPPPADSAGTPNTLMLRDSDGMVEIELPEQELAGSWQDYYDADADTVAGYPNAVLNNAMTIQIAREVGIQYLLNAKYATEEWVNNNFTTSSDVDQSINIALGPYSDTSQMNAAIANAVVGLASESYVDNAVMNLASENFVNSSIAGAVDGLASESYVDAAVANVSVDLTGYATESYVHDQIASIDIPDPVDLTGYATEEYVDSSVAGVEIDFTGYATEEYVDAHVEDLAAAMAEIDYAAVVYKVLDFDGVHIQMNGNDGIIQGGAQVAVGSDAYDVPRMGLPRFMFDGESSIEIPHDDSYHSTQYTLAAWINTTNSKRQSIICKGYREYDFAIEEWAAGTCEMKVWWGDGTSYAETTYRHPQNLNDGNWHHIMVSIDRTTSTVEYYVDNIHVSTEVASSILDGDITTTTPLRIGGRSATSTTHGFDGDIADPRVYTRILSQYEREVLYRYEYRVTYDDIQTVRDTVTGIQQHMVSGGISDGITSIIEEVPMEYSGLRVGQTMAISTSDKPVLATHSNDDRFVVGDRTGTQLLIPPFSTAILSVTNGKAPLRADHILPDYSEWVGSDQGNTAWHRDAAWHPSNDYAVICGYNNQKVGLYDWDGTSLTNRSITISAFNSSEVKAVAWSPDGTKLAAGDSDTGAGVKVFDWDNDTSTFTLRTDITDPGTTCAHKSVVWSSDGRYLAARVSDVTGGLAIWDWSSGSPVRLTAGIDYPKPASSASNSYSIAFSPDNRRLVINTWWSPVIEILDLYENTMHTIASSYLDINGNRIGDLQRHSKWSPDGRYIATTQRDAPHIYIFDTWRNYRAVPFDYAAETDVDFTTDWGDTKRELLWYGVDNLLVTHGESALESATGRYFETFHIENGRPIRTTYDQPTPTGSYRTVIWGIDINNRGEMIASTDGSSLRAIVIPLRNVQRPVTGNSWVVNTAAAVEVE